MRVASLPLTYISGPTQPPHINDLASNPLCIYMWLPPVSIPSSLNIKSKTIHAISASI